MSCRKCVDSCLCAVVGADGVTVTGTGGPADPYVVTVDLCEIQSGLPLNERGVNDTDEIIVIDGAGACVRVRAPEDIHIDTLAFNPVTGELTITETDGTPYQITLALDVCVALQTLGQVAAADPNDFVVLVNPTNGTCTLGPAPLDLCDQLQALPEVAAAGANDRFVFANPTDGTCSIGPAAGGAETPAGQAYPDVNGNGTPEIGVRYQNGVPATFDAATGEWELCLASGGGNGGVPNGFVGDWGCTDFNGTSIYQTNDGLRGVPDHFTVNLGRPTATANYLGAVVAPGTCSGEASAINQAVVNPSTCRTLVGQFHVKGSVTVTSAGGNASVQGAIRLGGGSVPAGSYQSSSLPILPVFANGQQVWVSQNDEFTIPPGGAQIFSTAIRICNDGPGNVTLGPANAHITGTGSTTT